MVYSLLDLLIFQNKSSGSSLTLAEIKLKSKLVIIL